MGQPMFGLDRKIKSAAATGGAMALAAAIAILGLVWLSIAAVSALSEVMSPIAAMCIVGAVAMAPMVVMLIRHRPKEKEKEKEPEPVQLAEDATAVIRLAQSAHLVAERAPVAGIALTLGAAFLAARSPTTSPLAMHMLAEAVERWVHSQPPRAANGEAHDAHGAFTEKS
jgi:cobalamin synthase